MKKITLLLFLTLNACLIFAQKTDSLSNYHKKLALARLDSLENTVKEWRKKLNSPDTIVKAQTLFDLSYAIEDWYYKINEQAFAIEPQSFSATDTMSIPDMKDDIPPPIEDDPTGKFPDFRKKLPKFKMDKDGKKTLTEIVLSYGLNNISNTSSNIADEITYKPWESSNWEYGVVFKTKLGGNKSKSRFYYGLTYNRYKFSFINKEIVNTKTGNGFQINTLNNAQNSHFNISTVNVPLGFTFKIHSKTEASLGGYVGTRVKSLFTKEFTNSSDEFIHQMSYSQFGLENFIYGINASIGYAGINIFAKYDLNNLFKRTDQYKIYTIGLRTGL